jgi:hypothetical protein
MNAASNLPKDTFRTNKTDAARRQIDAAIRMLFAGEDILAVATLAGAGCRIVRDLSQRCGAGPYWQSWKAVIKPEMWGQFWGGVVNKLPNFLKHADRDSDDILEDVSAEAVDLTLWIAVLLYADLGNQFTHPMVCFHIWMVASNPDLIALREQHRMHMQEFTKYVQARSRGERLAAGRELLRDLRVEGLGR